MWNQDLLIFILFFKLIFYLLNVQIFLYSGQLVRPQGNVGNLQDGVPSEAALLRALLRALVLLQ